MPQRIVIVGASGHAKVVADIVEREGRFAIAGLVDSFRGTGEAAFGYRLLGDEQALPALMKSEGIGGVLIAIGDNWQRARVAQSIARLAPQLAFVTAVHPSAAVARDAVLGAGCVVMAGAVVNPGTRLGQHCIVNTRASIDHDGSLGDFASLAPGATLGGNVVLGEFAAVGLGANIIHRRRVGAHAVVGAGALVLDDIPERCVAYGVPARVARSREQGEPYLQDRASR
jgi:sugar O-acyltransferase (sialic acid O-acetyltransferase NeuD family)